MPFKDVIVRERLAEIGPDKLQYCRIFPAAARILLCPTFFSNSDWQPPSSET